MSTTSTYVCAKGGRCEGDGWVRVGDEYVDGIAPWPAKPADDTPEALEAYELAVETCRIRRASAANTVYPCKACQPAAFSRWAGRHWTPEHDRSACDECKTVAGSSGGSSRRSALNERDRPTNEPDEPAPDHAYEDDTPAGPDMSYEQGRADLW